MSGTLSRGVDSRVVWSGRVVVKTHTDTPRDEFMGKVNISDHGIP